MGGKDDPNLDGDFVTLYEIKQRRQEARRQAGQDEEEAVTEPEVKEHRATDVVDDNTHLVQYRHQLCAALKENDAKQLVKLCLILREQNIDLGNEHLCEASTKETLLHTALRQGRMHVSKILIEIATEDFLTQDFEVTVKNHTSKKSTLHVLAETGGTLDLIKLLVSRLSKEKLESYLHRTVLMEIAGQRARHLEAIHIAALHGHTDTIEYLISLGVSVNTVNVKNDTPILWAARNNHLVTVRYLIQKGAKLNKQNDKGSTPLYWACRYGLLDMVRLLLKTGKADIHQERKLGLVSPVVLVSAYGYTDILQLLLEHGANVNLQIQGGFSPLHYAAQEGNVDTIKLLLQHGAVTDLENNFGDTPILLAARENEIAAFKVLAKNGANLDQRNNDGKTVWNYAIESKTNQLLETVVKHFKRHKRMTSKILFPVGKTPLHLAAAKGDISKIQCLLDLGTDAAAVDEGGNTFYHTAARENSAHVLQNFLDKVDINAQNSDGDSCLHLASYNGNLEAIQLLLEKVKIDKKNSNGETALHAACRSPLTSSEAVRAIVENIISKHSWSVVDYPDRFGNTALHVAARAGRQDLMECLKQLNPRVTNSTGDSPVMLAAKAGSTDLLQVMLDIFKESLLINQQNNYGESLLHVAVKQGIPDMVELLILAGSDLSLRDKNGSTPLHVLVQQAQRDRDNLLQLLATLDMVEQYVVRWWCVRSDKHIPDANSEEYEGHHREAFLHLLLHIPDKNGLSVLQYTAKHNALDMFDKIINTKDVFLFHQGDSVQFDVTNLTPDTMFSKLSQPKQKIVGQSSIAPLVSDTDSDIGIKDSPQADTLAVSCLELIVTSDNIQAANEMLDISPIQQIVKDYWNAYQWIYGFIMVIHIVYMSLFSVYAIPTSVQILGTMNNTAHPNRDKPTVFPFILFLLWPFIMLVFEAYYIAMRMKNWSESASKQMYMTKYQGVRGKFRFVVKVMWNNLAVWSCVVFVGLVLAWFLLYAMDSVYQIYVLATAFIIGWLFTIVFTSGFEAVHSYSIMLKQIVIRDITRFLFIYLFILLGFAFAFHAMFSVTQPLVQQYPSIWYVLFVTFNMMIGMGEIIDGDFDSYYAEVGLKSGAVYVKVVYLFYVILTTIILLNLLIAMMTDSYADVKAREGTNWRVGSIRLAIQLEKSLPVISLLKTKRYPVQRDSLRFVMRIPASEVKGSREEQQSEVIKTMTRLEKELLQVKTALLNVTEQLDSVTHKVDSLQPSAQSSNQTAGRFARAVRNRMQQSTKLAKQRSSMLLLK